MIPIRRALVSVSDKKGLLEFARFLAGCGVELVSTGGTARFLAEQGVPLIEISFFRPEQPCATSNFATGGSSVV